MKIEGINRVILVVKDAEKTAKYYSELFGVSFQDLSGVEPEHGVRSMFSLDGKVEICSPINTKAEIGKELATFLENRGEGVYSFSYNVNDIEEATAMAKEKGIPLRVMPEVGEGKVRGYKRIRYTILDTMDTHGAVIELIQGDLE